jgi:AraC-like DNA-binding protein
MECIESAHILTLTGSDFPFNLVEDKRVAVTQKKEAHVYETLFLWQGDAHVFSNGTETRISREALLIEPPAAEDRVVFSPNARYYNIIFTRKFLEQISGAYWMYRLLHPYKRFLKTSDTPVVELYEFSRIAGLMVHKAILGMAGEFSGRKPGYQTALRLKFMNFLFDFDRIQNRLAEEREEPGIHTSTDEMIESVMSYIEKHYTDDFTLESLAQRVGLTASYFSRIFKERAGFPVFEYINRIRIQRACIYLKRSNAPIIDIAYKTGYKNLSFFNRTFKKVISRSPRDYRQYIRS